MIIILSIIFVTEWFKVLEKRDRKLFREELIWYSRYQVVEEMYLNGMPDEEIYKTLLQLNSPIGTWIDCKTGLGYSGPKKHSDDEPASTITGKPINEIPKNWTWTFEEITEDLQIIKSY